MHTSTRQSSGTPTLYVGARRPKQNEETMAHSTQHGTAGGSVGPTRADLRDDAR